MAHTGGFLRGVRLGEGGVLRLPSFTPRRLYGRKPIIEIVGLALPKDLHTSHHVHIHTAFILLKGEKVRSDCSTEDKNGR